MNKLARVSFSGIFLILILLILLLPVFSADDILPPTITFESPTPNNGSIVSITTQTIIANISDDSENASSWIDFDGSLVGYWAMDYYNALGIFDNSSYSSTCFFQNNLSSSNLTIGSRGLGLVFKGGNATGFWDYLNCGVNTSLEIQENTLVAWIKPETIEYFGMAGIIASKANNILSTGGIEWGLRQNTGDLAFAYNDGSIRGWYVGETNLTAGNWYHIAIVWRKADGQADFYVNGEKIDTIDTTTGDINYNNDDFLIGYQPNGNIPFNGTIDELMLFNRTLGTDEIKALYNSTNNKFNATFTGLALGDHNYTLYAVDGAGNFNSSVRSFTMSDTHAPTYSSNSTNNTVTNRSTLFSLNVSDDIGLEPSGYYIFSTNNSGDWVNDSSVVFTSTPEWANVTKVLNETSDQVVGYRWFLNDSEGNTNSTPVYLLTTIGATYPQLAIEYPLNISYNTNVSELNYSYSEDDPDYCWYSNDSGATNSSLISMGTNFTNVLSTEGLNTFILYCNDTYGSENSTSISFTKDSIAPIITIISPTSGANLEYTNVSFNILTNENSSCNYSINGGLTNSSLNPTNYSGVNHTAYQVLSVNTSYTSYFYCLDLFNNTGVNSVSFDVDLDAVENPPSNNPGGGTTNPNVTIQKVNLDINPSEINLTLSLNMSREQKITVTNLGNYTTVSIRQFNLTSLVLLPEHRFLYLSAGETQELIVIFVSPNKTGIYTGRFFIGSAIIPVTLDVREKLVLFDSNIVVLNSDYLVSQGNKLRTAVNLIPLGDKERMDVTLNYVIRDYNDTVYLTSSETLLIEDSTEIKRDFDTGALPLGKYIIGLELVYPNGIAPSSAHFEITERSFGSLYGKLIFYFINAVLVILILIISLILFRIFKKMKTNAVLSEGKHLI